MFQRLGICEQVIQVRHLGCGRDVFRPFLTQSGRKLLTSESCEIVGESVEFAFLHGLVRVEERLSEFGKTLFSEVDHSRL